MGQKPKKFHITDDGDIYRINDDGSFTSMGNAEKMSESKVETISDTVSNKHKRLKYCIILILLLLLAGIIIFLYTTSRVLEPSVKSNTTTDSVAISETPVDMISSKGIEPVQKLKSSSVQDLPANPDIPLSPEVTQNEKIVDDGSRYPSNDATNRTLDDYNPELACGEMEGPNNFYVLFPDDKTHLCSAHKARIDRMIKDVGSFMGKRIVVDGYLCSYTGTYESIRQDARERTSNVVKYLKEKGVPDDIILVNIHETNGGFGPYGPVFVIVENK